MSMLMLALRVLNAARAHRLAVARADFIEVCKSGPKNGVGSPDDLAQKVSLHSRVGGFTSSLLLRLTRQPHAPRRSKR